MDKLWENRVQEMTFQDKRTRNKVFLPLGVLGFLIKKLNNKALIKKKI